jgi:SAM-dependent methyltransferase
MISSMSTVSCCFCSSNNVQLAYKQKFHKVKRDHGPYNYFLCRNCRSGFTFPIPNEDDIAALYESFSGGMSNHTRNIRQNNPLREWYEQCIRRILIIDGRKFNSNSIFKWVDIGAGNGELAILMARLFPLSVGYCFDYHHKPDSLISFQNIIWIQCDLNDPNFQDTLGDLRFDLVISITVLEHVLYPKSFLQSLISIINPIGGTLYLTTPDQYSMASKLLKKYWPYLLFGEHINIPSQKGMYLLCSSILSNYRENNPQINVKPISIPYPVTYYLDHFNLNSIAKFISRNITVNFNTGILEFSYKSII